MKLIQVFALDVNGFELNSPHHEGEETMKAARVEVDRLMKHSDYLNDGLYKVEIRVNGDCVFDEFVKNFISEIE